MHEVVGLPLLVNSEFQRIPRVDHLDDALLNAQLFVGTPHNVRYGLGIVVELHGKQVLEREGLRVHVKVLPRHLHQPLPVPKERE